MPSFDAIASQTVRRADHLEPAFRHEADIAAAVQKLTSRKKKPNILIYLMDDVGWGDFGCYGGGVMAGAPTPNIDHLAREGLMLTSCYSEPSCTPSRASFMTGRLPLRHGLLRPPMYGQPGGLDGEVTLAELLRARQEGLVERSQRIDLALQLARLNGGGAGVEGVAAIGQGFQAGDGRGRMWRGDGGLLRCVGVAAKAVGMRREAEQGQAAGGDQGTDGQVQEGHGGSLFSGVRGTGPRTPQTGLPRIAKSASDGARTVPEGQAPAGIRPCR